MKNKIEDVVLPVPKKDFRKSVINVEEAMFNLPNAVTEDALDKMCPLKHTFVDGMYVREIFMPKGTLIISKIHKYKHPYFVIKGNTSVLTEKGVVRIKAPFAGITERGTKRILYMHEDTVWITVHATDSTDLDIIEDQIIAKTFDKLPFNEDKISVFYNKIKEGGISIIYEKQKREAQDVEIN